MRHWDRWRVAHLLSLVWNVLSTFLYKDNRKGITLGALDYVLIVHLAFSVYVVYITTYYLVRKHQYDIVVIADRAQGHVLLCCSSMTSKGKMAPIIFVLVASQTVTAAVKIQKDTYIHFNFHLGSECIVFLPKVRELSLLVSARYNYFSYLYNFLSLHIYFFYFARNWQYKKLN